MRPARSGSSYASRRRLAPVSVFTTPEPQAAPSIEEKTTEIFW